MLKRIKQNLNDCNNLFYKSILTENDTPKNRQKLNLFTALLILFLGFKK